MVSSKDDSATNSDSSGDDIPESNSSVYSEGERVLAYHGPRIYEAKACLPSPPLFEGHNFWDEWVGTDRLMKHTEENVKKQQALDKKQGVEKIAKSGRSAQTKPKNSTDLKADKEDTKHNVAKGKKRKADSGTELVHLPRSPNVDDILTKYLEYRAEKDGMMTDTVGEILNGIRCYFDKALPVLLLYKKERQQYHEAVSDNVSPSSVYGAEHLLRLFVKLPELLSYVKIEEETLIRLQQKLLDFLKFLQKNQGAFFVSTYETAKASDGAGKYSSGTHMWVKRAAGRSRLEEEPIPVSLFSTAPSSPFSGIAPSTRHRISVHRPTNASSQVSLDVSLSNETSSSNQDKIDVIVISAGNKKQVSLEASNNVGGRVRYDVVDDFILDRGFQIFITA
nr:protein MRG1 isoform X2 [Ipomoea batatas]